MPQLEDLDQADRETLELANDLAEMTRTKGWERVIRQLIEIQSDAAEETMNLSTWGLFKSMVPASTSRYRNAQAIRDWVYEQIEAGEGVRDGLS